MHGDVVGVILSVVFIALGYVIHFLIRKKDHFLARKVLHIYICNWYFIYANFFESSFVAMIGLFAFAALNLIFEINIFHSHRYGTVYYPLSIIALLCLYERGYGNLVCVECAILAMGYGDGLAAIIGKNTNSAFIPLTEDKTVFGSVTMLVVSAVVAIIVTKCSIFTAFVIGAVACVCEAYVPFSLDNITVPVAVFFLVSKLC